MLRFFKMALRLRDWQLFIWRLLQFKRFFLLSTLTIIFYKTTFLLEKLKYNILVHYILSKESDVKNILKFSRLSNFLKTIIRETKQQSMRNEWNICMLHEKLAWHPIQWTRELWSNVRVNVIRKYFFNHSRKNFSLKCIHCVDLILIKSCTNTLGGFALEF